MENASKALIMAGGVLIAILILATLIFAYSQFSSAQQGKENFKRAEQIANFNIEYEAYNRDDVTGVELYSLYAKIQDYNLRVADDTTKESGANTIASNIYEVLSIYGFNGTAKSLTSEVKGKFFKCTKTEYNQNTGRISYMEFTER